MKGLGKRLIFGKNCIRELFAHDPKKIFQVYTILRDDPFIHELKIGKVPIAIVSKEELENKTESGSHQGIAALVADPHYVDIKVFLEQMEEAKKSVVLMLDSIYDPQNFGALLRAAECFKCDAVVWSKNRGCDLTAVAAKASVGASELLSLIKVSNLAETMKKFQDAGYWTVAADIGDGAKDVYSYEFPDKLLLILGSEGKGVQKLLADRVDDRVYIPMHGRIDSLNVSQAAAVMLAFAAKSIPQS